MDVRRGATVSTTDVSPEVVQSLDALCAASTSLASLTRTQSARERDIQGMCNSVWTVVQQQYSVSGRCGSEQQFTVSHQYTQQIAQIDGAKYTALRDAMSAHLSFATSTLASALFEHSLAEMRLLAALHTHILAPERKLSGAAYLHLLRAVLERLHKTGATAELDSRSLPTLRRLALLLGSRLLAGDDATQAGLSSLALGGPLSSGNTPGQDDNPVGALLKLLYQGDGSGWAAPLLQPALTDLVESRWLWFLLVNQPAEVGRVPAASDLNPFLAQIEWMELHEMQVTRAAERSVPRRSPGAALALP